MTPDSRGFDADLAALRALRRDGEALSARLAAGERALVELTMADPKRCVQVMIAINGRISAVWVAKDWRRRIEADDLAAAVLSAYEAAIRKLSQTWADAVGRASDDDTGTEDDYQPVPGRDGGATAIPADPTDAGAIEFGRHLFYVLQDVTASLDGLVVEATQRLRRTVTARGPGGTVTVVLTGGVLTGVSMDAEWLKSARHDQIDAAIIAAVHAGYEAVDDEASASVRNRWPFDELDRLTADPGGLLSGLGLPIQPSPFERG